MLWHQIHKETIGATPMDTSEVIQDSRRARILSRKVRLIKPYLNPEGVKMSREHRSDVLIDRRPSGQSRYRRFVYSVPPEKGDTIARELSGLLGLYIQELLLPVGKGKGWMY
jgi:hypothetical protein